MSLQKSFRSNCTGMLPPFVPLAELPTSSSLATSKPWKVHSDGEGGPCIFFVFSDRHATEWEFPHYVHARDIFVFSSYVTLIPLQCVPFILYQDMESLVLDIISLNTDELRAYWVFSRKAPCQASFRHLPLGLKWDLKHFDFDVSFTCQDTSSLHQDPARCVCLVFVRLKFTELKCIAVFCPRSSEDDLLQIRQKMFWPGKRDAKYISCLLLKIRLSCVLGQTLSQQLFQLIGVAWNWTKKAALSQTLQTVCLQNDGHCRLFLSLAHSFSTRDKLWRLLFPASCWSPNGNGFSSLPNSFLMASPRFPFYISHCALSLWLKSVQESGLEWGLGDLWGAQAAKASALRALHPFESVELRCICSL